VNVVVFALALTFVLAQAAPCFEARGAHGVNVWERAKEPSFRSFCNLLASGVAKLASDFPLSSDVLAIADSADKLLPGRAEPYVLRGRALLRLGRVSDAMSALQEASHRDKRAFDEPIVLLAWARTNAQLHRSSVAAQAYRDLLPRATALPGYERAAAAFEAGMLMMSQGPSGLEQAIALLRQARQARPSADDALEIASVVALALALDRAGDRDEAKTLLASRVAQAKSISHDPRTARSLSNAGIPEEGDALDAMVLEATDRAMARKAWQRYIDGASRVGGVGRAGEWVSHARAHAIALGAGVAAKRAAESRPRARSGAP
jgi:tetratricopeptide (TPR) repeat protein